MAAARSKVLGLKPGGRLPDSNVVLMPITNRSNNAVFSSKVSNVKSTPLGLYNYDQFIVVD